MAKMFEAEAGEKMAAVETELKSMGFRFVTLDLGGYEKGKMNAL